MDFHDPDVLVTGATGFIGRWLVAELLGRGRPVAVTVRRPAARAASCGHGCASTASPTAVSPSSTPTSPGRASPWPRPITSGWSRCGTSTTPPRYSVSASPGTRPAGRTSTAP
ncbi:SDR family oxidoreductase [Actinomadura latina]|uniref:SDR family oxidoreductase n=1 Tax=Actinomadura latina TaxID=163603 RepID=A0A846YYC1_9ACTN|nr:SDR family oxidoreductase [Actinomadura latina]